MVSPGAAAFTALWMSEKSHVGGPGVQTVEADADATGTRMAPIASTSAPANLGEVSFIVRTSACESAPPLFHETARWRYVSRVGFRGPARRDTNDPMRRGNRSAIPQTGRLSRPHRGFRALWGTGCAPS